MRISRHAGELPQSVNDFTLVSVTAFPRLCVPATTQTFTKAPATSATPVASEVGRAPTVSNVNRARSLENSFPQGKIIFELVVVVVDRHFGFRMSRTCGSGTFSRARYFTFGAKKLRGEDSRNDLSDLTSRS